MPDPDDLGTYDGHTIDVGPVSCPACKRPYVSAPTLTEEERRLRDRLHQRTMDGYEDGYAEVYVVTDDLHDALAIIDRLSGSTSTGGPTEQRFPNGYPEDPVLGPYEDAAGGPE